MSQPTPITAFDLAALLDLSPGSMSCVILDSHSEEFIQELLSCLDLVGDLKASVLNEVTESAQLFVIALRNCPDGLVVCSKLNDFTPEEFSRLDSNRSQLLSRHSILWVLSSTATARLIQSAPNLASFLGGKLFQGISDNSQLSSDEVEARLELLRREFEKTDEQLIVEVESDSIPLEPWVVEWLILLDRSDLVP